MSCKQDKKLRKMMRKEVEAKASALAKARIDRDMNMFKAKPRWFPMWLWLKGVGIFIKIERRKNNG